MAQNKERYDQKIRCNVVECIHNCIEDSTCRLEKIQVCPCHAVLNKEEAMPRDVTACASYQNAGDLNIVEITGRD